MSGVFPVAISVGFSACILLVLFSFSSSVGSSLEKAGSAYTTALIKAGLSIKPADFSLLLLGIGAVLWLGVTFMMRPPLLQGILLAPVAFALAFMGGKYYLQMAGARRMDKFVQQLELVLRMMSGALRVGLGLRQSIILVTEEISEPARREFMSVIGKANLGVSILDALDDLTKSMPSHEMTMMARSIRVQSTTGGDLAGVLETLATTIKDRRRIVRKMSALTAQGRGGAWIIGALPVGVGSFVLLTQHDMAQALLHTTPGYIALAIVAVLEGLAIFSLMKILQFDA